MFGSSEAHSLRVAQARCPVCTPRLSLAKRALLAFCLPLFLLSACDSEEIWPHKVGLPATLESGASGVNAAHPFRGQLVSRDSNGNVLRQDEYYDGEEWENLTGIDGRGLAETSNGEAISLNFSNASIREVLDVILTRTLKRNFFLDQRVQGDVTVRTSNPIERDSLLPMLENILALNGAAIIETENLLNIVPMSTVPTLSKQVIVDPRNSPLRPGIGVYIFPIRFSEVASVAEVASTQVSSGNDLRVDTARNLLIYTGPGSEAMVIADLVDVLDIDNLRGKSFALFPLQSADPDDVVDEVQLLLQNGGVETSGRSVNVIPVNRMNGILAVSNRSSDLRLIGSWVRKLDRSNARAGSRVYVYNPKHTRAQDLADVLSQIFEDQSTSSSGRAGTEVAQQGEEDVEIGEDLTADDAGRLLSSDDGRVRIVADERRNALVIVATAQQYELVQATLARIDVLPLQVLVEATIAEVTLTDELSQGLQWAFNSGNLSGSLVSSAGASVPGQTFPGFNLTYQTGDAQVVLNALASITDVKVVSSPQLTVLDSETARLQVGDSVPISTQTQQASNDSNAPIINTIEYFDTGVILEVTPHVNSSGQIRLEIAQEVSDAVATTTSGLNSPTISQRTINSSVSVASGATIALGGLIRETSNDRVSGVPGAKDIPVLGNLFRSKNRQYDRSELIVLITPRVIRNPHDAQAVTSELRSRLRGIESLSSNP